MRTKLYAILWALYLVAVGITWFADLITIPAVAILGWVAVTLIVIGALFRLQSESAHPLLRNLAIPTSIKPQGKAIARPRMIRHHSPYIHGRSRIL